MYYEWSVHGERLVWTKIVRGDFREMLEIHLYLRRQMHQYEGSITRRVKLQGHTKDTEIV